MISVSNITYIVHRNKCVCKSQHAPHVLHTSEHISKQRLPSFSRAGTFLLRVWDTVWLCIKTLVA